MKETRRAKETLRELFAETLDRLDPARELRSRLRVEKNRLEIDQVRIDLREHERIFLVAFGKAARPMAEAALEKLEGIDVRGLLVPPASDDGPLSPLQVIPAGHPEPDRGSLYAANAATTLLMMALEKDLVLFLVSGGGSAMLEAPLDRRTTLEDMRALHRLLVRSGAGITEVNTVRKHLSAVKGGRLAVAAAPARQLTVYVSDVPSRHPDAVASGPTMPDPTTLKDCTRVLERLGLRERLPFDLQRLPETPRPGDAAFARSDFVCLLDNDVALDRLRAGAEDRGWVCEVDRSVDGQPAEEAAGTLLERLHSLRGRHPRRTVAVLSGGELSCPVPEGAGTGGRNLHFALCCAQRIEGQPVTLLSAGTDGIDGSSPAAGALADGRTIARAEAAGLDPEAAHAAFDSFPFFDALGDTILTGPTHTNVRDLRVLIALAP